MGAVAARAQISNRSKKVRDRNKRPPCQTLEIPGRPTAPTLCARASEVRSARAEFPWGTDARRERVMLDINAGTDSAKPALRSARSPDRMDQAAGGEVLGALARTNARPGRAAGSLAVGTTTGGSTKRVASLTSWARALPRNAKRTEQ